MKVLLDTDLWWWRITGEPDPSTAQKRILARTGPKAPVLLSDISLWEVATLVSLGRRPYAEADARRGRRGDPTTGPAGTWSTTETCASDRLRVLRS